jgi:rhomboid protease GluP
MIAEAPARRRYNAHMADQDDEPLGWIERIARLSGKLGLNETRVRWKLLRWRDKRVANAAAVHERLTRKGYEHLVCPECGRLQSRGTTTCTGCGTGLSALSQVMRGAGQVGQWDPPVTLVMAILISACFVRQAIFSSTDAWNFSGEDLVRLGAHFPQFEWGRHEFWRLGTGVFLHSGIIHVAFNMLALGWIGPSIETWFGRGRTLFLFVATGILAFVPGLLLHSAHPSAGASGGIAGLIGVAAAWGQRQGTSEGLSLRNRMLTWMLMTTIMGVFVHADHLAHFAGFAEGAVFGWFFAEPHARGEQRGPEAVFGTIAVLIAIACVVLVFVAPDRHMVFQ